MNLLYIFIFVFLPILFFFILVWIKVEIDTRKDTEIQVIEVCGNCKRLIFFDNEKGHISTDVIQIEKKTDKTRLKIKTKISICSECSQKAWKLAYKETYYG